MSFYIHAIFRIKQEQLTKDLIRSVIRVVHANYKPSVSREREDNILILPKAY